MHRGEIAAEEAINYGDDEQLENEFDIPDFLTVGQKYSVPIGSNVVLPCQINESGKWNIQLKISCKYKSCMETSSNPTIRHF